MVEAARVPAVVQRDDVLLERLVEAEAVRVVLHVEAVELAFVADGVAVAAVVGFAPPAVEDAEVQRAVEAGLHAARAGRLQRTAGVVEPDVDALHEVTGDVHVVVLQDDDLAAELGFLAHAVDLLDEGLAGVVGGVRLAREDELHGPLGVVDDPRESGAVAEEQVGTLVRGEAAREADGERLGGEDLRRGLHVGGAGAVAAQLLLQAGPHELDHVDLEVAQGRDEVLVGDVGDGGLPHGGVLEPFGPVAGQDARVEVAELLREEREGVDAVGDVPDRHLALCGAGVEEVPHGAADLAVQFGHAVRGAREAQREDGHAERLAPGLVLAGQLDHVLPGGAEPGGPLAEVAADQVEGEGVVAGGDGRVRGEDAARRDRLDGAGEVEAARDELADALQAEEGGVALVHVEHLGVHAEGAQRADAADAEDELLLDAQFLVAAVEAGGEAAVVVVVARDVAVEEVDGNAADAQFPHADLHVAARDVDVDVGVLTVGGAGGADGERGEVDLVEALLLPAVLVDALAEVALVEEQADRREGQAEVAGALAVVAGEDAETAGVDGEALVEAVLHAEVRDLPEFRGVTGAPGGGRVHVRLEVLHDALQAREVLRVARDLLQAGLGHVEEGADGVVVAAFPQVGAEVAEEVGGVGRPAPVEVVRQVLETPEVLRELGEDGHFAEHVHTGRVYYESVFLTLLR